ncbi:hypothetical protein B0I72DRAFT_160391 [Yarrowia lipolytica]|uniref:YALI0F31427p n=2 Tax=Yarrowia lipolytica TaxID=4952 RepID=Q6BZR7_YARLI|nr:YALI0F31427p [Yarrowia lipolytica CLIB122]KAB8282345.1 hypothetical protein BKA91DRAFT_152862 [Yarrowia lipolytica]KAE8172269.1 hypothetical protein BKA90DRAFT_83505 [Yarrowia lipolytica]KAJ8055010.1 hypothetical protein LXG23DRAFT_18899 [Yarrowia lipolytica]RDW30763.1 hypothetical protein B0I72DRAFT_160391 [Yarrowia lipolytica]RDW43349.1 hypothetical protein B0I74DRAFT_160778 [Yarrowia lipolytica]|eukprot:XP_506095.2 YALI0F31427p [Yarrowia lipolytica CLIB122]
MAKKNYVVIGSGIAGLTTALTLSKKPNTNVTIVAKHLPGDLSIDFTSPWAGGDWDSFAKKDEITLQNYDKPAYLEFLRLSREVPEAGIWIRQVTIYFHDRDIPKKKDGSLDTDAVTPWYSTFVEGWRTLRKEELPERVVWGYTFTSVVISTTRYMFYVQQECVKRGVQFRRATLKHVCDAKKYTAFPGPVDAVFNCSGLSAKFLGGVEDSNMYPILGQTLLVRNRTERLLTYVSVDGYEDECLYIMPRAEGGTVLGGCMRVNDWSTEPDKALADRIVARATKACPELLDDGPLDVVSHNVGRRPARQGGPRVEKETIDGTVVIHNYGAGPAGFQSSIGMAEAAVDLLKGSSKL